MVNAKKLFARMAPAMRKHSRKDLTQANRNKTKAKKSPSRGNSLTIMKAVRKESQKE